MTGYVLDPSVAVKWVLPEKNEPFTGEASRLLGTFASGQINFLVPDLFWPEIGNVLWRSVRRGWISEKSAQEAIDWVQDIGIPTRPSGELLVDALRIALGLHQTVYDSIYLALAVASGRHLLIADERLASATGLHFPVRWLGALL